MPHFDFEVAGTTARLEGPEDLVHGIQRYFKAFKAGAIHAPAFSISWQTAASCRIARSTGHARSIVVDDPRFRFAATLALLAGEVAAARPDLVVLHANALRRDAGTVILAGESGAGKTTLTMELAMAGTGRPFAEDWVLLDAAKGQVLPFPRALNVRDGLGGERTEEHPDPATEPVTLEGATVFLLAAGPEAKGSPEGGAKGETWWLTSTSAALVAWLSAAGARHEADGALVRAVFPGALDDAARAAFLSTCNEEGALVVHTARGNARRRESPSARRPAAPSWSVLDAGAALPALVSHVVRPSNAPLAGAELVMRLARAFSRTRFVAMVPGGTPGDSARALAEALEG